jgi:transposase
MQYDGEFPKPPQRFTPKDFLKWVEKQIAQGWRVVSCYEAGPFGYVLHRQFTALGVTNYVIRPPNWDDQHKRVKTDRTDALAMLTALDRFVAGNPHALAKVCVPTEAQERQRTQTRIRQSLHRDLKLLAQRGRGIALQYGYRLKGKWYGVRNWPKLPVPAWLAELLAPVQAALAAVHARTGARTEPADRSGQRHAQTQRTGCVEPTDYRTRSRRLGAVQEPAAGLQLLRLVSERE